MADTPWGSYGTQKLFVQSGQFSSTVKTSYFTGKGVTGIEWDETNTPWANHTNSKLMLQSGQFTSTIKDSQSVAAAYSISYDGTNTPWIYEVGVDKLMLQSGQFTSTLKDSEYVGSIDAGPLGISADANGHTPWSGNIDDKLYLQSGRLTSTLKTSQYIGGIEPTITGISYDNPNTPWGGYVDKKLYLQSGQFTSTLKTSQDISTIAADCYGISTNDYAGRMSAAQIYERSITSSLTLGQIVSRSGSIFSRSITSTLSLGQTILSNAIFSRSIISSISLGQITQPSEIVYPRSITSVLSLGHIITQPMYEESVTSALSLDQETIERKIFGYQSGCKTEWPRWIFASVSKYFDQVAAKNDIHFFIEGTHRETQDNQEYIEFRMDGPHFTQLNPNYHKLDVEINILWSFNQDHKNFHEDKQIVGILLDAMRDICIYRYGDGVNDDETFLGVLRLKQDRRTSVRTNNFGQIRPDMRLMQGTVEGTYDMFLSC